ncbi:hypothetical protein DERP_009458 [Dermatophagoides pteronyssinus]|uniref:Uncharacterized protein n=1 Tax=Dermatophagoides pteronyssinus TaxID=6956 RepID=A0ABQ8IU74_DERPT|nr:hypothetical protein DERP_009458 [Dermatophagoides pteronyssinus]
MVNGKYSIQESLNQSKIFNTFRSFMNGEAKQAISLIQKKNGCLASLIQSITDDDGWIGWKNQIS